MLRSPRVVTGSLDRARLRRVPLVCAMAVMVGSVLSGCVARASAMTGPDPALSDRSVSAPARTPATPAAFVTVTPDASAELNPTQPIVVRSWSGVLSSVTATNVRSGVVVTGAISADKKTWSSTEPLGYDATYRVVAEAVGVAGHLVQQESTVHTLAPRAQTYPTIIPTPAQDSVGVGQPIVVRFSTAVTDRAAAQAALHVVSQPPQAGTWTWMSDTEVHYRPENYWAAGTTVTLDALLYGKDLGDGVYGATDREVTFHVHDAWIAQADGATHQMQIFHDGALVKTMPISMGKPSTPTHSGPHVISDKVPSTVMDSCTYGVCKGQSGYYRETVYLDERISGDGEFVHAAPWSTGQQGHSNVSHGCINLSPANAQWFYDHFDIGDVVDVINSGGSPLPVWDTYGDWEQ
ncbi:MAG: L,D-transpeptidase [Pseudonocardiaceae bacterium]